MSRLGSGVWQSVQEALPFLRRKPSALPRGQMLALKPIRSRDIDWEMKTPAPVDEDDEAAADTPLPNAALTVPRREDMSGRILTRVFRIPATRTIELDEINTQLWLLCDGKHSVDQLIKHTCDAYKMNRRQGEVGVITAMRMLAQRGLIGFGAVQKTEIKGTGTDHGHTGERKRSTPARRRRRH